MSVINTVCFDVGGTLIDDPFQDVIKIFREECRGGFHGLPKDQDDLDAFFAYWRKDNAEFDFPFASHFIQEEVWLIRALMQLNLRNKSLACEAIPIVAPRLLKRYRELAREHIAQQPQLPLLQDTLGWLRDRPVETVAASNDREFATSAMLSWSGLLPHFDHVFTSEGLSRNYLRAEKPAPEFFNAVLSELGPLSTNLATAVYVGDSEARDILPPRALGFTTVRYFNAFARKDLTWLDSSETTVADYAYSSFDELRKIMEKVLGHL